MGKELNFQLTIWVSDELELSSHLRQLKKYETSYELREEDGRVAIFIDKPKLKAKQLLRRG